MCWIGAAFGFDGLHPRRIKSGLRLFQGKSHDLWNREPAPLVYIEREHNVVHEDEKGQEAAKNEETLPVLLGKTG